MVNIAVKSKLDLATYAFQSNPGLDIIVMIEGEGQYLVFLRSPKYQEKVISIIDDNIPEVACVNILPSRNSIVVALTVLLNSYSYDTSTFPPERLRGILNETLNKKKAT